MCCLLLYRPVQSIQRGDRAGICVTQLNPKLVERGLAAAPGSVPTFSAAVAIVDKVRFYAGVLQAFLRFVLVPTALHSCNLNSFCFRGYCSVAACMATHYG
jgi:selenocysteine-specific elongation factor